VEGLWQKIGNGIIIKALPSILDDAKAFAVGMI
jgi:hypothetical protein